MTQVFNTHKFLYTLFHEGSIKGHKVTFENKEGKDQTIEISAIEIGASPISCRLYDIQNKKYTVAFIRIKKIYFQGELVWDGTTNASDAQNVKVIKAYD